MNENPPCSIWLISQSTQITPKFIINPQAIALIKQTPCKQISFISICGDYRSGKSFLLNSLFFNNQGFKISGTVQPCTKGINIWSRPILTNGKTIWILDTEGFGATDRDDHYDLQIFMLTTLISGVLMYNSFGALDENTINKLSAICKKSQNLDANISNLTIYWILRDFSLSIQSKCGLHLSACQYLQQSLDQTCKQSRLPIKQLFSTRYCIPLVRPVIDQTSLSKLNEIKFQQLRGEFVQEIYKLRKSIMNNVEGKVVRGFKIGKDNLQNLLQGYVNAINSKDNLSISTTWDNIITYEIQKSIETNNTIIRQYINKQLQKLPFTIDQLQKVNKDSNKLYQNGLSECKKNFKDQNIVTEIQKPTKQYFNKLLSNLVQKNQQFITKQEKSFLRQIFENLLKYINEKELSLDSKTTQKILQKIWKTKDQYFRKYQKFCQPLKSDQNLINKDNILCLSTKLLYYQHFFTQQKTFLPKIICQFSQQLALNLIKSTQQKKTLKLIQNQNKKLKQINQKLQQKVQDMRKNVNKAQINQDELKRKNQMVQNEMKIYTNRYQKQLKQGKKQYQTSIQEFKQTILSLQKDFLTIKKQHQLERQGYIDRLRYEQQRCQLLTTKLQQIKTNNDKSLQQVKQDYEQKLKKSDEHYQQLQSQFQIQRKKFLQLNKSKKQQQSQLLEDLAQKNQKLLNLRRQVVSIQHAYKQQMDNILNQQKQAFKQQFILQLEQKQHQMICYQQKLEQYIIRIHQLQQTQKHYQLTLIQLRLSREQHQLLAKKYEQLIIKLKKNNKIQQQKQAILQQIKQQYRQQLSNKQQLLKKLKTQLKKSQQQHTKTIYTLNQTHKVQLQQLQQKQQQIYEQKMHQKIVSLAQIHKQERKDLHDKLLETYQEIQEIKNIKQRLQADLNIVVQFFNRIKHQIELNQQQIVRINNNFKKKYQKRRNNLNNLNDTNNPNDVNNRSYFDDIQNDDALVNLSHNISFSTSIQRVTYQIKQVEETFYQILQSQKILFTQRQDIKYTLKQTVFQLQQCQTHISNQTQQLHVLTSENTNQKSLISTLQSQSSKLSSLLVRVQSLQKQNNLLKAQVQVRQKIYQKRQIAVKDNIQLYKDSFVNLTQQNNQLQEKCHKMQRELQRFTDWERDFTRSYQSTQHIMQNQEQNQNVNTRKLQQLEKQNRRLRKQLHTQRQVHLINIKPSSNSLLQQTQHNEVVQALKKQNILYKKRIQQLRQRQLKLLQQIKDIKSTQKHNSQLRVNLVREQFQQYRKKTKQQILTLEKRINQINQEKYKLKQEIIISKQQKYHYTSIKQPYQITETNNNSNTKTSTKTSTDLSSSKQQVQQLINTITLLKSENNRLCSQINTLQAQIHTLKNQNCKKMAQSQLLHESILRKVQSQKSHISLQMQRNKTKYEHLLKVNTELMKRIQTEAKIHNQLTLKEKYKSKISNLFMDNQSK